MSGRLISGDRTCLHREIRQRAAHAADGLRRLGVGEGDSVALLLRNDAAFFEAVLAAGLLGAYPVPINWRFTADEVGYILEDSGAKALVAHDQLLAPILEAVPRGVTILPVRTPSEIASAYGLSPPTNTEEAWEALIAAHPPLESPSAAPRASMIYTSGTTGRPKGVRRAPAPPGSPPPSLTPFGLDLPGDLVVLINGPMYHSAPNAYGMAAFQRGADIVLQAKFDAEEMLALIERHRVTHMHIVPTMFVRLLALSPETRGLYDLSSLRFVVHGAAPCPPHVKQAMIDWWGPVINEYYGSTETGLVTWLGWVDALRKPGSVGRPVAGAAIHILDDEGRELPAGLVGEVYVRTARAADFTYHGQDERRREIARGDLVSVGDVGHLDQEGYLYLCDRKRDMIISGGVNIYPAEIEAALIGMPGVRDCAVFGIPDEEFGEAVCAYVEPEAGEVLSAEAVRAHLAGRLARYKLPRLVEFAETLPREDSGKIFKRKLREPYWAGRSSKI